MDFNILDGSQDKKYFTIIPNYILNHSSAIDKAIYIDMKRVASDSGLCFMTEETMCKRNRIGKEQLHKSLKYLIDHKWIEFTGTTPCKTRPIKTYKILDIWRLNNDFFDNKKIPPETALSKDTACETKDTAVLGGKIPPETGGIIRTNTKEDIYNNILVRYQEKILKNSRLTDLAKNKIKTRLLSFSESDLLQAIDNFAADDWYLKNCGWRGMAWFFHSDDRIEKFINLKPRTKQVGNKDYKGGEYGKYVS